MVSQSGIHLKSLCELWTVGKADLESCPQNCCGYWVSPRNGNRTQWSHLYNLGLMLSCFFFVFFFLRRRRKIHLMANCFEWCVKVGFRIFDRNRFDDEGVLALTNLCRQLRILAVLVPQWILILDSVRCSLFFSFFGLWLTLSGLGFHSSYCKYYQ